MRMMKTWQIYGSVNAMLMDKSYDNMAWGLSVRGNVLNTDW
jgi:hypothetical protein